MFERFYRKRNKRRTRIVLCVTALLLLAAGAAALVLTAPRLEAVLVGEPEITLEYGESYTDAGVLTLLDGEAVDAQVTVEQPQMDLLGTYTVRYTARYQHRSAAAERLIHVVDTTPPEITLFSQPGYFTQIGCEYLEEGYSAADNYDGDLTDQVQRTVVGDLIYYSVRDSSGNITEIIRQIIYGDTLPPVITLTGGDSITVPAGTEFSDPGFTAVDNADGDVTAKVTVTGDYDPYRPGTYTFTYSVTDSSGNTAQAVRKVTVKGLIQEDNTASDDKVIYLTFDDGPGTYTLKLLEVLAKYNVKATFFVVGTAKLDYLDEIAAGGHSIGIHTNTHEFSKIYASETAFFNDFNAVHEKILERTGIDTKLCRFPGGSSNTVSKRYCPGLMTKLTAAVEEKGFTYFDWNVDSNDAGGAASAEEVYNNVIRGVQGRQYAVVLQHDIKDFSVDAVEKIIQWGLANGYTFRALDENSPTCHHKVNN